MGGEVKQGRGPGLSEQLMLFAGSLSDRRTPCRGAEAVTLRFFWFHNVIPRVSWAKLGSGGFFYGWFRRV